MIATDGVEKRGSAAEFSSHIRIGATPQEDTYVFEPAHRRSNSQMSGCFGVGVAIDDLRGLNHFVYFGIGNRFGSGHGLPPESRMSGEATRPALLFTCI